MTELKFTLWQMFSLIGVIQCVYILVYIISRVANLKQIILPSLYFLTLGTAFFLDFGKTYIGEITPFYDLWVWAAWGLGLPFSVLLIIQVAQLSKLPSWPYWGILFYIPLGLLFSYYMTGQGLENSCGFTGQKCSDLSEWLRISSLVGGALSLLLVWSQRNLLEDLHAQKSGKERYWLILALIMLNIGFLIIIGAGGSYSPEEKLGLARTILGLAFIYLVTTSLFRIYPQALILSQIRKKDVELSPEDGILAQKIHNLLTLDKVYHEPTYSRSNLAKELGVSEASVSRVINGHYKKSLPQLLNEQRIADAKRLLLDTNVNIKIVAQEVGFNSIPSFNRVFKELEGCSPSDYRKNMIK